jgi:hypothetical protein
MNQEQLTGTTDEFFNDIDPKRTSVTTYVALAKPVSAPTKLLV